MDARKFFIAGTIRLTGLSLHFALWLAIFMALAWGIRHRPAKPYAEGDEISSMFAVAVRNAQGEIEPRQLNQSKNGETLVREDTVLRDREGIYLQLTRLPPDTFELFYASNRLDANAFMTARYRIAADNKVIPVSFKVWSVAHGFWAFFLSFPVFMLVKRLVLRRLGRKKQPALQNKP
ncbi:hypothetical protein [Neisseria elongata]|uniref:hypothetical protein n=1 Tax=Neisseria elongata TaxID=495 RepID=UPI000668A24D|nr:hypothetical protein [Neisseria elongata]